MVEVGGLGGKGEGIKKKKRKETKLTDTANNMVITRGEGGVGMVMEGDLTWGGEHAIEYTDDEL